MGTEADSHLAGRVKNLLEGTHLPHYFDVLMVESLGDAEFRRHILEDGLVICDRGTYAPPAHHRTQPNPAKLSSSAATRA